MDEQQVQFLPFHAINEFMVPEYRQRVIQTVLSGVDRLPGEMRSELSAQVRQLVQVPGFRNSAVAPLPLKVRGAVQAFERHPEFVANILAAWSELHPELRQKIYDLLKGRGWELLPIEADRRVLPGFLTRWPKADSFEVLDQAYREENRGSEISDDDINLMITWMCGRLPYEMVDSDENEVEEGSESESGE